MKITKRTICWLILFMVYSVYGLGQSIRTESYPINIPIQYASSPDFKWISPTGSTQGAVFSDTFFVSFQVKSLNPIDTANLSLSINGTDQREFKKRNWTGGSYSFTFEQEVILKAGDNDIQVAFQNSRSNINFNYKSHLFCHSLGTGPIIVDSGPNDDPCNILVDNGKQYALILTNEDYRPPLEEVEGTHKEGRRLEQLLVERYGFAPENVYRMEDPSRNDILDRLGRIKENCQYEDRLVILFSGHGAYLKEEDTGYWIFPSTRINSDGDPVSDYINYDELYSKFRGLACKHILVINDACGGGAILTTYMSANSSQFVKDFQHTCRKALCSSSGDEITTGGTEFLDIINDLLEYNQSPCISMEEIARTVIEVARTKTRELTPKYGNIRNSMPPDFKGEFGEFIFFLH